MSNKQRALCPHARACSCARQATDHYHVQQACTRTHTRQGGQALQTPRMKNQHEPKRVPPACSEGTLSFAKIPKNKPYQRKGQQHSSATWSQVQKGTSARMCFAGRHICVSKCGHGCSSSSQAAPAVWGENDIVGGAGCNTGSTQHAPIHEDFVKGLPPLDRTQHVVGEA